MRHHLRIALLAASLGLAACDLDTTNPNAPTQETVVTTQEGLIALGVGLQNRLGTSTGNFIYGVGLVTDELGATTTAFSTISDAESGTVPPTAGFVSDVFSSEYRTIKTANDILFSHEAIPLPQGMRSGVVALAYMAKAAALGELLQAFREVAIDTYNDPTPTFVDRATALDYVVALLDSASRAYNDTTFAETHATFNAQVRATGLDIPNTILAYKARYGRLQAAGQADWQAVLDVADSVNRTVFSVIPQSAQNQNFLFTTATGSSGVLPRAAFRTSDAAEVQRTTHFVTAANTPGRIGTPLDNWRVFSASTSPIPTYYPDEVLLIKAEALVNLGRLAEARAVVDSVRTDCPNAGRVAADPGPCLLPYSGVLTAAALLDEIYRNRRFELFATGLRWEDLRRIELPSVLGRDVIGASKVAGRCWLPYPLGERNANPENVPADPEGTEPQPDPPCLAPPA